MRRFRLMAAVVAAAVGGIATAAGVATGDWQIIAAEGRPTARHEAAFIEHDGKLYLLGGRGVKPVDMFDPKTNRWTAKAMAPREFHHFQPVVVGDAIYIVGALEGKFRNERPLDRVIIYHPKEDRFSDGPIIPEARRRGAGGVAVHRGKIYWAGGNSNGHIDGYGSWFDELDPRAGKWRVLPDAPQARDHFQAVMADGDLYAIGGRRSSLATGQVFDLVIQNGDMFDFVSGKWRTLDTPAAGFTTRAGLMAARWGRWIIYAGGESAGRELAHDEVEAFDPKTGRWADWPKLQRGRHGSGLAIAGGKIYVAAGSGKRGGQPELDSIEMSVLPR